MRTRLVAVLTALALVVTSLGASLVAPVAPAGATGGGSVDLTEAIPATFDVAPGVEHLTVTGAQPRSPLTLVDAASLERIVTFFTDDLGQLVYQYVPAEFLVHDAQTDGVLPTIEGSTVVPGTYLVVSEGVPGEAFDGPVEVSEPVNSLAIGDVPDVALYEGQTLSAVPSNAAGGEQPGFQASDGFGYIEMRDGTLLSANIRLPDPTVYGPGPYPTLVQYSGYAPSRPGVPSGADAGGMLAGLMGFAYVGVNMRGSGCSGGVFDAFNAAQAADGYDIIETVARQPWVKNNAVGMMGISYSGITQLYVAATNPPSLAAITPLSVIEDPWYQQWPGGIYNAGFTQQWLAQRDEESTGTATWVQNRISGGDTTCESNLQLRSQNIPFEEFGRSMVWRPASADDRNLSKLVRNIDVPVFLAGSWQDEQTGSRFGLMLDEFESVPPGQTNFLLYNGHHPDGFSPLVMSRWFEFLSFYVDRTVPELHPLVRIGGPIVLEDEFGAPGLEFEPDRFRDGNGGDPLFGGYEGALAAYEAEDEVRVLFEAGASPDFSDHPGAHRQRFVLELPSWPAPDTEVATFHLGPDGTLSDEVPDTLSIDRFEFDADVLGTRYYTGGNWSRLGVNTDWRTTDDGLGLAYETEPLESDLIIAGEGHVDLWFRSTGSDAPLEVVLSEVYAEPASDGTVEEVRVQHGLLRAGFRNVDPDRTQGTRIDHLYTAADYEPLVPGQFVNVQVPLYSVAHPFRAGSRLRIEINTPGGDAALWDFESEDFGATTHDVAHGGPMASALVLPVLSGPDHVIPEEFAAQSERPLCGSLRGQPCRDHRVLANETVHQTPPCDAARFGDVDGDNTFCTDITWLADSGITGGFEDGSFKPTAPVSRQAMAAFLYRKAGAPDGADPACEEAAFSDVDVDHPFCGEIEWLANSGITGGFEDGSFKPTAPVSRQAMAAFLYRKAGAPDGTDPPCVDAPFSDVGAGHPFCGEITWMASNDVAQGFGDGSYQPTAPVSRQAMAAFLQRFHILLL
ncbi:MAG: CocE/NonD family hydrolase [Acidimicrobiia bacterium]|nr:CocE/NonD family hydrolase [Acidimicrobiia bacterium]